MYNTNSSRFMTYRRDVIRGYDLVMVAVIFTSCMQQ